MKKSKIGFGGVFPLILSTFLLVGCGEKKNDVSTEDAAAPTTLTATATSDASVATATGEDVVATGENASVASGAKARGMNETAQKDGIQKPAELDAAVEAHIQKTLKENPDLAKAEAPIQMTYFFIRALQANNDKAVRGMLTLDAFRELASIKGVPCPDFIQNSEVVLGNVQYLSDEKDESKIVGARVGTIWKVQTPNGIVEENIAWVFRFEDETWLVAGMISVLDPKYPPILINFEDLAETEQQYQELEKEIARINAEAENTPADSTDTPAEPSDALAEPSDAPAEPSDAPAEPSDAPAEPK